MVVRTSSPKPHTPLPRDASEGPRARFEKTKPDDAERDLRGVSRDAHEGLAADHAYSASAPSALDVGPSAAGESLDFDGRDLGATVIRGDGKRSLEVSGGLSTGSAWAGVTSAGESRATDTGVSLSKSWVGLDRGVSWATGDGGASRVAGGVAWYPGGIAIDGSVRHTNDDDETVKVGGMSFFDADRAVNDLGPVPGAEGRRRIELRRSTGTAGTLSPGVSSGLIGVGGRIAAGKERAVLFRTTVSDEDARALVHEKKGVVGWLRDKARAREWADDPVVIPDVREPTSLQVGDELVTTVSGTFGGGLFIGGLPLRLGAYGSITGEFQLGVRRLDEHRMEVVVAPTRVKALQGRVGSPWLLEGDLGKSTSAALAQGFVFDLRDGAARAAYEKVLDGELPGGLPNTAKGPRRQANELISALEEEMLPAGVKRSYVDQVELKRTQTGASVSFTLWFKGGSLTGLGMENASLDERRVHLDARGAVTTDTRGTERRRQVLLSGEEERGVYASLARTTRYDDGGKAESVFDSLTLTLQLSDSKLWKQELDDEIVRALNEGFGLSLPKSERDGRRKGREVTVTRRLEAADLARLAELSTTSEELAPLADELRGKSSDHERALAVQTFVARGGLDAMGAVVRALGGGREALVVDSSAEAYSGPVAKASELTLRYPAPVAVSDENDTLAERFELVAKALAETKLGLEDLEHEPILRPRERAALKKELKLAEARLARLVETAHLSAADRATLIARLEHGWTTSDEQRVIDALRA